jgi:hypothetical protein
MPNIIRQGVDCFITASNIIGVTTGEPVDVTGYTVYAAARAIYGDRYHLGKPNVVRGWWWSAAAYAPIIAEWSTSPTGTQGTVIAGLSNGGTVTNQIQLHVTPTQTSTWRCPLVIIQAEMTDPNTNFVGRIIDEIYEVNFAVIVPGTFALAQ